MEETRSEGTRVCKTLDDKASGREESFRTTRNNPTGVLQVNNAGIMKGKSDDFESVEHFDYLFAVNVRSAIQLTQLAAPHLAKTQGSVVNLSSVMAINAYPENYVYGLTKTAIMHYTKNAAVKYGPQRIRVNCVL